MKKFIKKVLILFCVLFTILTIIGGIYNKVVYYMIIKENVIPILNKDVTEEILSSEEQFNKTFKENYGDNAPTTTLAYFQGYLINQNRFLGMQIDFLVLSIILAIVIEGAITLKSNEQKETKN